jgi:hypothetical protein
VCFQREPGVEETEDCCTAKLVNKVYPRDHPELKFLDQSNHPLAAAAEEPFLTTGAKSLFPLGLLGITNGMVRRLYPASSWDVNMNGGGIPWSYTRSVLISARQSFIW